MELSYRPNNVDNVRLSRDEEYGKIAVNQVRRVANHFTSMFSYRPRLQALGTGRDKFASSAALTHYLTHTLARSNLDTLHPQQAHYLAVRGDAVYGCDWNDPRRERPKVFVRTFDPHHCYPLFNPDDLGGLADLLVAYEVPADWAEETFGIDLDNGKPAQMFYYWTSQSFHMQIEEHYLGDFYRHHGLGFVPFRWVFGDASGLMAQADVREVPKLQEVFNEGLLLALDAIRKQIDPAWWAQGIKGDLKPEPGTVSAIPEGAQVGRWPIDADPQIVLGIMGFLEQSIQSSTGISPISMQGQAKGSIVTGSAVRHQVEAAEQRAETRKAMLQAAYARLGEMVLKITRQVYPESEISFVAQDTLLTLKTAEIDPWAECQAVYGGFLGLPVEQRVQIAMQGLGRLWDEEYALGQVIDAPGLDAGDMRHRLKQYQIEQAKTQAEAQSAAQQLAQKAQEEAGQGQGSPQLPGGPSPTGSPQTLQPNNRPRPPSPQELRRLLAGGSSNGQQPA